MKKLGTLLCVVILLICGCTYSEIKTVVMEDARKRVVASEIEISDVNNMQDFAMESVVKQDFLGFDAYNRAITVIKDIQGNTRFVALDVDSGASQLLYDFGTGDVSGAVLANRGKAILLQETRQNNTFVYKLTLGESVLTKLDSFPYAQQCTHICTAGANSKAFAAMLIDEKYYLYAYDLVHEDKQIYLLDDYSIDSSPFALDQNIKLLTIFWAGSGQLVVQAEIEGTTHIVVIQGHESKAGEYTLIKSSAIECVSSGERLFYVNDEYSLMVLDMLQNEEIELAKNVGSFSVALDGETIAYSQKDGLADQVYVKNIESRGATLVDIRQGIDQFILSRDGSKILLQYTADENEASYPYVVFNLEQH